MYLIRQLTTRNNQVEVVKGLEMVDIGQKNFKFFDEWWGTSFVNLGMFADLSKFEKLGKNIYLLSYVSEYSLTELCDNYKNLFFSVNKYDPDNIEGFILFIRNEQYINTSGQKLFSSTHDMVIILKEGQFVEFSGQKVEMVKGKLSLV